MSTLSGGPNIVTDGLVLYLDAANPASYVSGSTAWRDISRGGNNGTLVNGPTFNPANGGSIVFDEIDDYFTSPNNASLNLTQTGGAVGVWFQTNVNATGSINGNLVAKTNTYTNGYWLVKFNDKLRISIFGSGSLEMIGVKTITDNIWHYALATWTPTQLNLYVDGVLDRTQSYNFTFTTTDIRPLYIGRQSSLGEKYFKGNIAQAQIYNRTLSAQEIFQNYNSTKGRFGL
jgi:hypothetical protein